MARGSYVARPTKASCYRFAEREPRLGISLIHSHNRPPRNQVVGADGCNSQHQEVWRAHMFLTFCLFLTVSIYVEGTIHSISQFIIIIIIIYLLQLGLHPVAVVLTLHNYNKKHTISTTKTIQ
jgi:hypothetical protein